MMLKPTIPWLLRVSMMLKQALLSQLMKDTTKTMHH